MNQSANSPRNEAFDNSEGELPKEGPNDPHPAQYIDNTLPHSFSDASLTHVVPLMARRPAVMDGVGRRSTT